MRTNLVYEIVKVGEHHFRRIGSLIRTTERKAPKVLKPAPRGRAALIAKQKKARGRVGRWDELAD